MSAEQGTIYILTDRLQIEELSVDHRILHWKIEEWSADQRSIQSSSRRSICGSKDYLHIKIWPVDRRSIWSADWRTICRLKIYFQREDLFEKKMSADWRTVCKWKSYMQIEEVSADRRTVFKLKNHLQIEELSAYQRIISLENWKILCNQILVFRYFFNVQITWCLYFYSF